MIRWKRGHPPQLKRFWNLADIWLERPEDRRPLIEVQQEFGHLLDRAVKDRLVSDVPLGAFLSGGLDSSTIVALMLRHSKNVDTFSIGFPEASYNELPYARETARQLGTRHVDQTLDVSNPELLLEISSGQDEPFADTSIVPTYALCHMARQRVTVALSGDGGDELLAGYVTHAANALHRFAQRLPTALTALARWTLDRLPVSRRKVNLLFKAKQFMAGASLNTCDAHASWRTLASRSQLHRLMSHRLKTVQADPWNEFRLAYQESLGLSPLDRLLYVDYKTWLPDDVLVKVDRASMAHGLEVRSPFLDHRLVEFCAGLPNGLKLRRFTGKHVLRRFASGLVPQSVLRRRKAGFNAPVSHWLAGPWKSLASQAFSPDKLEAAGVLDSNAVGAIFAEHLAGRQDHGYLLFALLMLSLWLERVRPELS
jgi:asparagine synthase (glutamine-hydrolysing)